jgi:predicted nucleic acid-binding protein
VQGYLIDTNVISEFAKPAPNPDVLQWFRNVAPAILFVSAITLGEIRLGTENLPIGKRRTDLETWLENGLPAWFTSNLLPVTAAVADRWGRLTIQAKNKGITVSTADGLIAATAMKYGLALVTRNSRDFESLGIAIADPWVGFVRRQP